MSSSTQQSQQQQVGSYQYEKELNYCINIAIEAGIIAMEFCNNRVQLTTTTGTTDLALGIEQKLDDSPVTLVDKKLDALIKQKLEVQFPDCLVVGEESSASIESTQKLEQGKVFFVDPIDGTKEFISNNGEWCVMIGLNIDGRPELGVVYVASRDQLFYASRGNGSFVMEGLVTQHVGGGGVEPHWIKNSEQRVSLSRQLFSNQYTDASQMVCLRSRSHDEAEITSVMNELKMDKAMCSGSFGIKCALIAEGKADLYINASKKTHYWDSCAPSVIATEAGAVLLDMDGNELQYTGVATNTVHTVVMFATLKPLKEQVMRAVQKVYASRR